MTDLLAEVNKRVREVATRERHGDEKWDFQCECGESDCRQVVSLTLREYELVRAGRGAILAGGHEQSRYRTARELSAELRDEATALRQQAQHQADRARRLRNDAARRLELVCAGCGYGVTVERPPDRCPMCSAWDWRPSRRVG